jgi:hypothetical protein
MTENRRYFWRAGLAVAVVGVASIGAIGIASASDERVEPRAAVSDDHPGWRGGGPWGGWRGGPHGGPGGGHLDRVLGGDIADLLHGEVVLAKEDGGTQTVLVQKGAVTEVSGSSVTVTVAKDEQVVVIAPTSGDEQTATVLVDLTDLGWE